MRNYPKYRKPAGTKVCPKCGDVVQARGLSSHMRLKHPVITYVTKVIDTGNKVIDSGNNTSKDTSNSVITQVEGKDLTECVRPDGKHLYTDNDLEILLAKITRAVFDNKNKDLFGVFYINDLIADFERRFECTFKEVKRANPHIVPKKTDNENYLHAKEYAGLKYSR